MNITTRLRSIVRRLALGGRHYGEHNLLHPNRDWVIGVCGMLALCVGGGVWAATTYLHYQKIASGVDATPATVDLAYRPEMVEAALVALKERAVRAESAAGSTGISPVVAPSATPRPATTTPVTPVEITASSSTEPARRSQPERPGSATTSTSTGTPELAL